MSFTVELDEQTAAVMLKLAAEEHRPAGEIIRDAVATYAQLGKRPPPKGMGQYNSGQSDVSIRARELIRKAAEEGIGTVASEVPPPSHPQAEFAGTFKDDPLVNDWKRSMAAYRRKVDEDVDLP